MFQLSGTKSSALTTSPNSYTCIYPVDNINRCICLASHCVSCLAIYKHLLPLFLAITGSRHDHWKYNREISAIIHILIRSLTERSGKLRSSEVDLKYYFRFMFFITHRYPPIIKFNHTKIKCNLDKIKNIINCRLVTMNFYTFLWIQYYTSAFMDCQFIFLVPCRTALTSVWRLIGVNSSLSSYIIKYHIICSELLHSHSAEKTIMYIIIWINVNR
jgi:hypothetical protein